MWDVDSVAQGRTGPYRTYPANTSGRLPLPRPWGTNPRDLGQLGTWRIRGDVPQTPGFGAVWNMAAGRTG